MTNLNKSQRNEVFNSNGWTMNDDVVGFGTEKAVSVSGEFVKEQFEKMQNAGQNKKRNGYYFVEAEKAFCYKVGDSIYTLVK